MGSYSIGVSALATAQAGLLTTEHNISNVNTPGFRRQQIVQSANIPQYTGVGFLGQGAQVVTVKRIYSQMLDGQLMQAQTQSSQMETYYAQVKQLDNMLADPSAGVSPALQEFFNGVQDVATSPASIPSRQAMLSGAQTMVARFQAINQRFTEIRDGVNGEIRSSVGVVNSYAQQIANLNQQIGIAQSAASSLQPANDLLDQRDQLVGELNQIIKVSTVQQTDGSLNVFIGNGQSLVIGAQSFTLAAASSPEDPERLEVGASVGGSSILFSKGSLTGGTLGGLLAFRDETLDSAQNSLGRVAIGLAQTFNDQHRLGMDLNGALGTSFFNVAAPKVISNTSNSATSALTVSFSNVSQLTTSDYKLTVGSGPVATLTRLSDNAVLFSGATLPQIVDGLTFSAMTAVAGDSFLIKPTINGARDVSVRLTDTSKIAAAAPIKTSAALGNTGSGTVSSGTVNSFNDKVVFTFTSASTFDVVDTASGATLAKNVAYTSGGNISYNGWTVKIANGAGPTTPAMGDTFTIDHTVVSTTSTTATIGQLTLASPPVDPFLSNSVRVVFDTAASYHLEGLSNNITGASSISGGVFVPVLSAGPNPGITVTGGAATIGASGAGSYVSNGTKTTITGGTITDTAGVAPYTITGATLTVEGGGFAGSTTFSGLTVTVDGAGTISIPAVGATGTASTFNGRPATGLSYASGGTNLLSANGWTVSLTGAPAMGDTFTVGTNAGGVADNRNALLLAGLQTQNILAGGTTAYQGAYSQLVSFVGNKTREVEVMAKAQTNLVSQTQQAQQAVSGVNLDEEAANLIRYQQAYQAAGKMMQVATTLFDTLLSLGK